MYTNNHVKDALKLPLEDFRKHIVSLSKLDLYLLYISK